MKKSLFAEPRPPSNIDDCFFYHVMDVPGYGTFGQEWDLRPGFDNYVGGIPFEGRRVLEIGPASGFLTFEMEKRGASVVCVEVEDDPGWDFVPFPPSVMEPVYEPRRDHMRKLKNSFWLAHAANHSRALVHYGNVYELPKELGRFDVSVMGCVLLHCHSPLQIVAQCAALSDSIIIADLFHQELEGSPVCRLVPSVENLDWGTWWRFSTSFFTQFLNVLGFPNTQITRHFQLHAAGPAELFTIVANR